MNITYIHHSGFLVELEHSYLLFDYIGMSDQQEETHAPLFLLPNKDKPVIVMASHRHRDHFASEIFEITENQELYRYLLSHDIKKHKVPAEQLSRTDFIKPGETLVYGASEGFYEPVKIETLKSTDEGVAFLVSTEGKTIYHAGDLNNWTWNGEADSWNHNMQVNYRREIALMAGREIDAAFIPLDPRLEDKFYLGIDDFFNKVGADLVFPMHLWGKFDTVLRFKELDCTAAYRDKIVEIHHDNECFSI